MPTTATVLKQPLLIIVRHFPKLKAAEHEVVERIAAAANELGWATRLVDVDNTFDFKKIAQFEEDADLVLDIHYEYPKFFKPKSVGAVWTPTSFMLDWDLPYVWENQLSHDFLAHTDSKKIIDLLSIYRPNEKFSTLNHAIPLAWQSWIDQASRNEVPRAFYAGINWTKLSGRPGRHNRFFEILDKQNVLDIYGPKKIGHVIPWEGFSSYRGEIPFDGKTILRKARESGISLVLSAEQHFKEGVISSRLFEGLAAGNAIIADRHPFIIKNLGKTARYLDFDRGDDYAARQLCEYVEEFQTDNALLIEAQSTAASIFEKKFNLTDQLEVVLSTSQKIDTPFDDVGVLVVGSSKSNILFRLRSLGFTKIEFTNSELFNFQDMQSLAKSLNFQNFLVLNGNTEFLDGFGSKLGALSIRMTKENAQIGVISTVALSQNGRNFQPVLVPISKSLPLNGLLIKELSSTFQPKVILDTVPGLRIGTLSEISYASPFQETYDFLMKVGKTKESVNVFEESIRTRVTNEIEKNIVSTSSDIAEEIRRLPKSRKTALALALAASIPGIVPLASLAKWIYRKTGK